MSMIIYSVTVKVVPGIHNDWVSWMKETHIPDVLKTGYFQGARMTRVMQDNEADGITYNIQYEGESFSKIMEYQEKAAPALQKDHMERYEGKFVAFRTFLRVVDDFKA